jgi:hypothetical protein
LRVMTWRSHFSTTIVVAWRGHKPAGQALPSATAIA